METEQLHDDDPDDARVTAYHARLKGMLDQVAERAKQALAQERVDIPLFFVLPSSGSSIVNFGTVRDPDDQTWRRVSTVVAAVIKEAVGIPRVRCREMHCAATHEANHQLPSVQSAGPSAEVAEPDNRFRLPPSHPHLAEIRIDPVDWYKFQQFDEDNPATRILGHDTPCDGRMTVYVACASKEVHKRLEDAWH